ncbi:MAG: murein biosynthesis integral membrane protein MurJ [Proteobacteria bacterium]|nr:murein biosynthesis integral membrane protein MurJ [Pseudomonadota bacterium]
MSDSERLSGDQEAAERAIGACEEQKAETARPDAVAEDSSGAKTTNDETADGNDVKKKVKRIGVAAVILSAGIMCSRLLGFVRDAVIAYQSGAGAATDAYNAAFLLPDLMNHFLAGGTLAITFIPLFSEYISKDQPKKAERLFSLIATTMGSLLLAAITICYIFTHQLVGVLFPGFDAAQIRETVAMTRIILPGQFFHYIGALMMAVLMARGQFVPSALAPLIYNLMIIVSGLVLGGTLGMKGFAIGALAGAVLGPFLLPLVFLRKKLRYQPVFGFKDADFKKYILLTLPLMLGASLTTVDEWAGRILGSMMPEGSISCLNYARRLVLVPIALVGQAAGQAALPYLSQLAAKGDVAGVADTLHKTLKNVILLSMIMIGFFVVLAEPMVSLVYERGAFSAENAQKTAMVLRLLSISIVFWTIQMVSVRAYYAAQNTLTPMLLTTAATALSIPIYYGLSMSYGLYGLAAASCLGMALQSSCVVAFYHRKNAQFRPLMLVKALGMGLILGASAGLGSYAGLWLVGKLSIEGHLWRVLFELGVSGIFGVICVTCVSLLLIPDELKGFMSKVRRKVLKR